jgi:hypothetical protein
MHKLKKILIFRTKIPPKSLQLEKTLSPHSTTAYIMRDPKQDPDPDLDPK